MCSTPTYVFMEENVCGCGVNKYFILQLWCAILSDLPKTHSQDLPWQPPRMKMHNKNAKQKRTEAYLANPRVRPQQSQQGSKFTPLVHPHRGLCECVTSRLLVLPLLAFLGVRHLARCGATGHGGGSDELHAGPSSAGWHVSLSKR